MEKICPKLKIGNGRNSMLRKFNIGILVGLCMLIFGLCTFTVFAASKTQIRVNNSISFQAEGVYYRAEVEVYGVDMSGNKLVPSREAVLDKSGIYERETGNTSINFNELNFFSIENKCLKIVYKIKVINFSEQDVNIEFQDLESKEFVNNVGTYITNDLTLAGVKADTAVIPHTTLSDDNFFSQSSVEFILTTSVNTLESSFEFDNSFTIALSVIEE